MPTNRGVTSLKRRKHTGNSMREFDGLPTELRAWVASASLPWRPKSVRRAFDRALSRTQSTTLALRELDRIERNMIARDVRKIWGADHPDAGIKAET